MWKVTDVLWIMCSDKGGEQKTCRPLSAEHFLREAIRSERLQGNFRLTDSKPFDAGEAPVTTLKKVMKEEHSRR